MGTRGPQKGTQRSPSRPALHPRGSDGTGLAGRGRQRPVSPRSCLALPGPTSLCPSLPGPACPCLPLPGPACPCLALPVPACPCLSQPVPAPSCITHVPPGLSVSPPLLSPSCSPSPCSSSLIITLPSDGLAHVQPSVGLSSHCASVHLLPCLSIYLSVCSSVCRSVHPSILPPIHPAVPLSIMLPLPFTSQVASEDPTTVRPIHHISYFLFSLFSLAAQCLHLPGHSGAGALPWTSSTFWLKV